MQPSLTELTRRFLNRPTPESPGGDVEPYDVQSAFLADPQAAWQETLIVLKALGVTGPLPAMPADWPQQVRQQAPIRLIPMALGHYPQMVSDFSKLLEPQPQTDSPPEPAPEQLTAQSSGAVAANEAAAALWRAGRSADALAAWTALPDSAVKFFNLGLVHLQLNDCDKAKLHLKNTIAKLPVGSGWARLAELYLALAESKC